MSKRSAQTNVTISFSFTFVAFNCSVTHSLARSLLLELNISFRFLPFLYLYCKRFRVLTCAWAPRRWR